MPIYAIAGTFFQEVSRLTIIHRAESEGGSAVALLGDAMSHAFSGHFAFDQDRRQGEGVIVDAYGASRIIIRQMNEQACRFTKEYHRSRNLVQYELRKTADAWKGKYHGESVGCGEVRCLIFELEPELFTLGPEARSDD